MPVESPRRARRRTKNSEERRLEHERARAPRVAAVAAVASVAGVVAGGLSACETAIEEARGTASRELACPREQLTARWYGDPRSDERYVIFGCGRCGVFTRRGLVDDAEATRRGCTEDAGTP